MVAKINIYNDAIALVGGRLITSLSEDTNERIYCDVFYDKARQQTLVMHPWNFAVKRAELAEDVSAPAFGYDKQYVLPSDCLKVIATENELSPLVPLGPGFNGYLTVSFRDTTAKDDYKIEGRRLLTNDESVKILYLYDVDDASLFSSPFRSILSYNLAIAISYKVSQSTTRGSELKQELREQMPLLLAVDGTEGSFEVKNVSNFVRSRM